MISHGVTNHYSTKLDKVGEASLIAFKFILNYYPCFWFMMVDNDMMGWGGFEYHLNF